MEESAKRRRVCENDGTARGASSTHASTEGQEVATLSGYDYEVFLSFRGPDTRAGFTDFLYTRMMDMGIRAYKDDEDLQKGEEFGPKLLQAIEQSKISMPIFSKGYPSSVWCLKELVKMVECQKTKGQKIIPIFYDVAPSVVRYQTGIYAEALLSHEEKQRYGEDTIREWKAALSAIGAINGWDLHSQTDRREGEFAREVTQKVFSELKKAYLVVSECLVSVDNHVDAIMEMIGARTSETRIIGIHGMGGIGKTTIAKLIYNKLLQDFENYCFLRDIRETSKVGIQCLQNQLISNILKTKCIDIKDIGEGTQTIKDRLSNKRVLLLLDDVEEENHIDALVGKPNWLGRGSKIIITTRNKDILDVPEVDHSYELHHMDPDRSLQLFSKNAFRRDSPLDEYIGQSKRAIGIAKGLPLALEVIGSLLGRIEKKKWDLMLKKWESVPHETVQSKLKISYDALDVRQQHIFLDIACIFIGYDKDIIVHFWDESKYPEEAMEVLQNISLIKIEKSNRVWMHDQLRDLGREIVRRESKMKIEKQSRVWDPKEALDLLRSPKGRKEVEALCLQFDHERQHHFTHKDFKRISNLRFLQVDSWHVHFSVEERLLWHESPSNVLQMDVFREDSNLLPQLRWLSWRRIPPTFKITNFSMKDVVILDLSMSEITHDWKGWSHMKVMKNLKVMNLTNCDCLERTPDFSAHLKLERLMLWGCHKLVEIDKSICQLKSLVFLDVGFCRNLSRLPNELGRDLASLEYLNLSYFNLLERLPHTIGNLESLIKLDISNTRITKLPNSIGNLESLIKLDISNTRIKELPNSIGNLESLIKLDISNTRIKELPNSIGNLESLIKLDISNTRIKELPNSIGNLESLIELDIRKTRIEELPNSMENLKSMIKLHISSTGIKKLPNFIENLESLIELDIRETKIEELPNSIGNLKLLNKLNISQMGIQELPHSIINLESLIELDISITRIKELPDSIGKLKNLKVVKMNYCSLSKIPDALWTIEKLEVIEVQALRQFDVKIGNCIYGNRSLRILILKNGRIYVVPRLPESLINLELSSLYIDRFPDFSNLTNLKELELMFEQCDSDGEFEGESDGPVEEDPMPLQIGSLHGEANGESDGPVEIYLPRWVGNLSKLKCLSLWSPYVTALPADIRSLLPQLNSLLLHCPNLRCLPSLPSSLSSLNLDSVCMTTLPADTRSLLPQLGFLKLKCPNLRSLPSLPSTLSYWELESECLTTLPTDMSSLLPQLGYLQLQTPNLRCIPSLPSSLYILRLDDCKSCCSMEDLSNLKTLSYLKISNCAVSEIRGLDCLENRGTLWLSKLQQVEILPDLSNLNKLRILIVCDCGNLVEIQGELPPSLEVLRICNCESLRKLPDLSSLKGLQIVEIKGCGKLNVEAILEKGVKFEGDETNKREKMTNLDANSDMDLREKTGG